MQTVHNLYRYKILGRKEVKKKQTHELNLRTPPSLFQVWWLTMQMHSSASNLSYSISSLTNTAG